jgi:hypothetical protein
MFHVLKCPIALICTGRGELTSLENEMKHKSYPI